MEAPLILEGAVQCEGEVGESWDRWGAWRDDVCRKILDTLDLSWGPLDRLESDRIQRRATSGLQVTSTVPH